MLKKLTCSVAAAFIAVLYCCAAYAQSNSLGIFDGHTDIGVIKHKGTVSYDAKTQQYEVTGSGADIWYDHDDFHYLWKKMKGDFILRTNGAFLAGDEPNRKYGLMVRKTLDANSAHVNVMVHGMGVTSMQYRKVTGGQTAEDRTDVISADVVQLERKGNTYYISVARKGDTFGPEKKIDLDFGDEVYVGVYACSHNADKVEKVQYSNVRIVTPAPADLVPYKRYLGSAIELLDMESQNSRIVYQSPKSLQAPNWMKNGKSLIYNSDGTLYNFNLATGVPTAINTNPAKNNNNDHVISFDGKMLTISSGDGGPSIGYTVPVGGGEAKAVTKKGVGASYMHGWSPDGKYLVFCGDRGGEYDVYRIPSNGGPEERFTTSKGLDDGPEYTPDGKYIYFNSVRSGLMQVWRMDADGSNQTQITNDDYNNWFPHISPDGKWIVYISFLKSEVAPGDHPFYKHVYIRVMPATGGPSKVVAYLYGGQGTINTPSWSPDSKRIAFVSNSDLLFPVFPVANN
jgi:TolB protein